MKNFTRILCLALVAVLLACTLASCAPNKDPDKAVAALKDEGYAAGKDTVAAGLAKTFLGINVNAIVSGTKTVEDKDGNKKPETVTIYYFDSKDDAKKAFEKYESDKEKNKDNDSDWVFAQSGAMIYYGTKAAVKAAK